MRIRPYTPADDEAVARICMLTGHAGQDATPYYRDGDLLPDTFTRPYLVAEPELAFVAEVDGEVVGYVLGTADTVRFVRWWEQEWLPVVGRRHPLPAGPPQDWHDTMTVALHRPGRMVRPELTGFPAHIHTNTLPQFQRRGIGRAFMEHFLEAVARAGAPGVHAAHGKYNISARMYYKKMGFTPLTVADPDPVRYVGRAT